MAERRQVVWGAPRACVWQRAQRINTPFPPARPSRTSQMIIEKDGLGGLFGRGLRTKILANAVQVGARLQGRAAACAALLLVRHGTTTRCCRCCAAAVQLPPFSWGRRRPTCIGSEKRARPHAPAHAPPPPGQGIMFSVLWRMGQDMMAKAEKEKAAKQKAEEEAAKKKK
jgi:hypothetical protein